MEFLDALWFDAPRGGTFGLVKARDPATGEIKYYMGPAAGAASERDDANYVIAWGTKMTPERRKHLIAWLGQE